MDRELKRRENQTKLRVGGRLNQIERGEEGECKKTVCACVSVCV